VCNHNLALPLASGASIKCAAGGTVKGDQAPEYWDLIAFFCILASTYASA